jgi:hypothetical protein
MSSSHGFNVQGLGRSRIAWVKVATSKAVDAGAPSDASEIVHAVGYGEVLIHAARAVVVAGETVSGRTAKHKRHLLTRRSGRSSSHLVLAQSLHRVRLPRWTVQGRRCCI